MFPEGYYYQHPEPPLTVEDYINSRWISKPVCLHDCDRPIQVSICYIYTTAERASDLKQPPVYILNHASNRPKVRSLVHLPTNPFFQKLDICFLKQTNFKLLLQT